MTSLLFAPRSLVFADVDAAFEVCPILDEDALRHDIACKHSRFSQLHTIFATDVAVDPAMNYDFLRCDVRANAPVGANREAVIVQFDAAFYFSVNKQIFTAGKFALHHYGFANVGNIGTSLLAGSIRIHGTDLLIPSAGQSRRSKYWPFDLRTKIPRPSVQSQDSAIQCCRRRTYKLPEQHSLPQTIQSRHPETQRTVCLGSKGLLPPEQHYRLSLCAHVRRSQTNMESRYSLAARCYSSLPFSDVLRFECWWSHDQQRLVFTAICDFTIWSSSCTGKCSRLSRNVAVSNRTEEPGEQRFCHRQRSKTANGTAFFRLSRRLSNPDLRSHAWRPEFFSPGLRKLLKRRAVFVRNRSRE